MKLLNFNRGPIPCATCHRPMRPTRHLTGGWPARTAIYGHHGSCQDCATALAADDVGQHPIEPEPAPAEEPSAVIPGTPAPGAEPPAPEPAPAPTAPGAATPTTMPRRRPRRRFDYHPDVLSICPSCGAEYDVVAGVCHCNRPA